MQRFQPHPGLNRSAKNIFPPNSVLHSFVKGQQSQNIKSLYLLWAEGSSRSRFAPRFGNNEKAAGRNLQGSRPLLSRS